ncbi:MAG: peptide-methionine (S)-S-oxide reductase MsrA [Bacteroidales bacterium]
MKIFILLIGLSFGLYDQPATGEMQRQGANEMNHHHNETLASATFGSGCFWCSEAIFSRLEGVKEVSPGYSGGEKANPTYNEVSTGQTGHAEVIRIEFDPGLISYMQLLEVFFKTHDPTTLNRQGADIGTQYRSVIFYHNDEQKDLALKVKERLDKAGIWDDPIVTEVSPLEAFYRAEDYHHDYFANNPNQGYCQFVIMPKVKKFEELFGDLLKE